MEITRQLLCATILALSSLFAFSQEKILVIGFPEKNFKSDWKPIEKYAKKNEVSINEVDDLFVEQLLSNLNLNDENFMLINIPKSKFPDFSNYEYSTQKNKWGKEYFGLNKVNDSIELRDIMKINDAHYVLLITQYQIYRTLTTSLRTKIEHRIDYQILNNDLKIVSADKFKLSGTLAGTFKPKLLASYYKPLGRQIGKRLFIDLAKIDKQKQLAMQDSQLGALKPIKVYEPKHGIGYSVGWGAPYGYGVEYSYLLSEHFDINVGVGISLSGLRTGVGTRFYFNKEGSSPFLATNYVYTSGLSRYAILVRRESGTFRNFSDQALFFRGGYKFEYYNKTTLLTIGYGFPFDNRGAELVSGSSSSFKQRFAEMQALGGIEISYTLIFKLGK